MPDENDDQNNEDADEKPPKDGDETLIEDADEALLEDEEEETLLEDGEYHVWNELRLHPLILKSIYKLGFKEPTPIQKACIPAAAHQGKVCTHLSILSNCHRCHIHG